MLAKLRSAILGTQFEQYTYLVGGSVRDIILGKPVSDYDLCIELPEGQILLAEYLHKEIGTHLPHQYNKHSVILCKLANNSIEISPTQTQHSYYNESTDNIFGSLEQDALSRDFTINALYVRLIDWKLLDPTQQGIDDINNHIIRAIGNPKICIKDDPLRMLRAIRLSLATNFCIEISLKLAIKQNAILINQMPQERITQECKQICSYNVKQALELLLELDLLPIISPLIAEQVSNEINYSWWQEKTLNYIPKDFNNQYTLLVPLKLAWLLLTGIIIFSYEEAHLLVSKVIKSIDSLLCLPQRVKVILQKLCYIYLFLVALIRAENIDNFKLICVLNIDRDLVPYLHFLLSTDYQKDKSLCCNDLISKLTQLQNELQHKIFPLRGKDILPYLEDGEQSSIRIYLQILELHWLKNSNLTKIELLNRITGLRRNLQDINRSQLYSVLNTPRLLWELDSLEKQGII